MVKHARDHPGHQHPPGAVDQARHIGADDEDARADHDAHHDHGGVEEVQSTDEALVGFGGYRGLAHGFRATVKSLREAYRNCAKGVKIAAQRETRRMFLLFANQPSIWQNERALEARSYTG